MHSTASSYFKAGRVGPSRGGAKLLSEAASLTRNRAHPTPEMQNLFDHDIETVSQLRSASTVSPSADRPIEHIGSVELSFITTFANKGQCTPNGVVSFQCTRQLFSANQVSYPVVLSYFKDDTHVNQDLISTDGRVQNELRTVLPYAIQSEKVNDSRRCMLYAS